VASWILFLVNLFAVAVPLDIHLAPESESVTMVVSGAMAARAAGAFSGSVSLNGSSSEVPIAGMARPAGERLVLSLKLKYRDLPEDWANRFRASDFDYRLRGKVAGGGDVDWAGTQRWDRIQIEKREQAASGFVQLGSIELTEFSLFESAARAHVTVRNPLSFPLKVASTRYRLFANGREVGSGATADMTLGAAQVTALNLPIDLDHGQLLAAAGSALRAGGQVEGRLQGALVVHLAGGDIPVPIDLSGRFSVLQ
jgi:LEA14-like dessication related protein